MISIVNPEAVGQVLRPTVYRAPDSKLDPRDDRRDERREPQEKSVELRRVRDFSDAAVGAVAAHRS